MSKSDPWSQYNLRSDKPESRTLTTGSAATRPKRATTPVTVTEDDALVSEDYRHPSLLTGHSTIGSAGQSVDNSAWCNICSAKFTGAYRLGNLARHVRSKHPVGGPVTYVCRSHGCHLVYQRSDARRNHELRRHPELQHRPNQPDKDSRLNLPLHEYILQGSDTFRICEQRPDNRSGPLPELFNDYSSTTTHGHDQDSVFSYEIPSGTTFTDTSSISQPSSLQSVGSPEWIDSHTGRLCCPIKACKTRLSRHKRDFTDHFSREHMNAFLKSTTEHWQQHYLPECDLCHRYQHKTAIAKHIWDCHILATGLDSEMHDLELGNEFDTSLIARDWTEIGSAFTECYESFHTRAAPRLGLEEHRRRQHSSLGVAVTPTQNNFDQHGRISSAIYDPLAQFGPEAHILVGDPQLLPSFGQYVMDRFKSELEPSVQAKFWTRFFERWDGVLEVLKSRGSESYQWFSPVLEIIRRNVQLHSTNTLTLIHGDSSRACTNTESQLGAKSSRKRSNPSTGTSGASKRAKQATQFTGDSSHGPKVEHADTASDGAVLALECVVYKHHLMNGTLSQCPCTGFSASCMSRLVHDHLRPGRTQGHDGVISFLERCKRCKELVVDQELWLRHERYECVSKTQKQGGAIAQWAKFYVARYPDALQIPEPRVGQMSWLSDAECEQYKQSVRDIFPSSNTVRDSFLDHQSLPETEASPEHEDLFLPNLSNENFDQAAAYNVIIADMLDPLGNTRDEMLTQLHNMPAPSFRDIVNGTVRLLSNLFEESIRSASSGDCQEFADQLEQLLPTVSARLRQQAQPPPGSPMAAVNPTPVFSEDVNDYPSFVSENENSRQWSQTTSSRPGYGSSVSWNDFVSWDDLSTQTDLLVDRIMVNDEHQIPPLEDVPSAPTQPHLAAWPPQLQGLFGAEESGQGVAMPPISVVPSEHDTGISNNDNFTSGLGSFDHSTNWGPLYEPTDEDAFDERFYIKKFGYS